MSPEPQRRFPDWAERERPGDMRWIANNIHRLWLAAQVGYQATGRGAITVDTTQQTVPGLGHAFGYLAQANLEPLRDAEMQRILQNYDPAKEMVVVLVKSGPRTSTYRLQLQPRP